MMEEKLFLVEEVAQLLGAPCAQIHSEIKRGLIDICQRDKTLYVPIEALKNYILSK